MRGLTPAGYKATTDAPKQRRHVPCKKRQARAWMAVLSGSDRRHRRAYAEMSQWLICLNQVTEELEATLPPGRLGAVQSQEMPLLHENAGPRPEQ